MEISQKLTTIKTGENAVKTKVDVFKNLCDEER